MADGATEDATSLSRLVDIIEPEPVSWWPLAPGWWIVIALAFAGITYAGIRLFLKWRRSAYRRSACSELDRMDEAVTVEEINALLKRTALCAWPRKAVASLNCGSWITFLETNGPLTTEAAAALGRSYSSRALSVEEANNLKNSARDWIKRHRQISTKGKAK